MRGHPEDVDRALSELGRAVSSELTAQGWVQRDLNEISIAILTHDTGNAVLATAEIARASFQWPQDWPITLRVELGVGYEPALNLMPLLTLYPNAMLLPSYRPPDTAFTIALHGIDDVPVVTRRIVTVIGERAIRFAEQFSDAASIERALPAPRSAGAVQRRTDDEDGWVGEHLDYDAHAQLRLVLIAAMGRLDEARTLLSAYSARTDDEPNDRDDRRFIRQLTRWLDAGGPAAPPVAETLAQLPRDPKPAWPSWAATRAKGKLERAANDAVKSQSKGKTVEQIVEMLSAEYSRRNLDLSPLSLTITAQILHVRQQPFGRARSTLKGLNILGAGVRDTIRTFKRRSEDVPEWLNPPQRASYPVKRGSGGHIAVTLDPQAHSWLIRAWTEPPQLFGLAVFVDVWLTYDTEAAELIAHIGDQRVGTVPPSHADAYRPALHAAALFDEDPITHGLLSRIPGAGPLLLEIKVPRPPGHE